MKPLFTLQVYLYERDQIASNPVKYPRQILPYVIIKLEKKVPCVPESPFLAVGSDETRSTWEVKGETRRGFRFMFTKSGLKGKHKVFTRRLSKDNRSLYLREQILEMRTKPAKALCNATPPFIQKIDDSIDEKDTKKEASETSEQPDLRKCSVSAKEACKKENNPFRTEFKNLVLSKSLRNNLQLTYFNPRVKLKRLNSSYLCGTRMKTHNKKKQTKIKNISHSPLRDNSSSENPCQDTEKSSDKGSSYLDSKLIEKDSHKKVISDVRGSRAATHEPELKLKIKESRPMDANKNIAVTEAVSDGDKVLKKKIIDHGNSRKKHVYTNRDQLSEDTSDKIETRRGMSVSAKDECKTKSNQLKERYKSLGTASGDDSSRIKNQDVSLSTHSLTQKMLGEKNTVKENSTELKIRSHTDSFVTMSESSKVHSAETFCANKANFVPIHLCSKDNKIQAKQSASLNIPSESRHRGVSYKDGQTGTKVKTDKKEHKKEADVTNKSSDSKFSAQNPVLKAYLESPPTDNQTINCTTLEKSKTGINSNEVSKFQTSSEIRSKTTVHSKLMDKRNIPKEKNTQILLKRLKPTKRKFGKVVYTVDKDKTGNFENNTHASGDVVNRLTDETTMKIVNEFREFDSVQNNIRELNQDQVQIKVVRKENEKLESLIKCSEAKQSAGESMSLGLESKLSSVTSGNKGIETDNSRSDDSYSEIRKNKLNYSNAANMNTTESRKSRAKQSNHCPHNLGVEKSKSPVIANAAPDMLNMSPVLVSAKTSTSNQSGYDRTHMDKKVSKHKSTEKKLHRDPEKIDSLSEMSLFLASDKRLGLIEHFPESLSQTHIVNPVLRASFTNKTSLKGCENKKVPGCTKDSAEIERCSGNQISNPNMHNIDPKDYTCPELDEKRSSSSTFTKVNTSHTKTSAVTSSTPEAVSNNNKKAENVFSTITDCSSSKTQNHEVSNSSFPFINHDLNKENTKHDVHVAEINSKQPLNDGSKTVESVNNRADANVLQDSYKQTSYIKNPGNSVKKNKNGSCAVFKNETNILVGKCKPISDESITSKVKTETIEDINDDKFDYNKSDLYKSTNERNSSCTDSSKINPVQPIKVHPRSAQNEKGRNVKVDRFTADRLRTFLNTAATSAMQRPRTTAPSVFQTPKSLGRVNDSADDNNNVGTPVSDITQRDRSVKESFDKETIPSSTQTIDSPSERGKYVKYLFSTYTTESPKTLTKATTKEIPHQSILTRRKTRDSIEMHDNDSQDTIIGGVTDITQSPLHNTFLEFSNGNEKIVHSDGLLSKVSSKVMTTVEMPFIKQENQDDGFKEHTVMGESATEIASRLETVIMTDKVEKHTETETLMVEVKQEPEDDTYKVVSSEEDDKMYFQNTASNNQSSFFPRTREELKKGAELLSATACRSAIVNTLKELSSVLTFLTESHIPTYKQTEKVESVAKEMCNVLSGEKISAAVSVDKSVHGSEEILAFNDPHQNVHVKKEPENANEFETQLIFETDMKECRLAPNHSMQCSEKEIQTSVPDSCSDNEQEFKYEYILKSSDQEQQPTNEILPCLSIDFGRTKDPMQETVDLSLKSKNDNNETVMSIKNEKDALPQLFDPSEEADITSLEVFGIPYYFSTHERKLSNSDYVKINESEMSSVENNSLSTRPLPIIKPLNDSKLEETCEKCEPLLKSKPKQSFSFKTGLLNKGPKERKNMFDLRINSSRRKTIPSSLKAVSQKTVLTPAISKDNKNTKSNCISEKVNEVKSSSKENHDSLDENNQHENVVNEVYKTVSEKLLKLKGQSMSENVNNPSDQCPSKQNNTRSDLEKNDLKQKTCKNVKGKQCASINKNNKSDVKDGIVKGKGNGKKHPIIPFKTVILLKKRQYQKYRRGESNKKFIDYREVLPSMYEKRHSDSNWKSSKNTNDRATLKEQTETSLKKNIERNEHLGKKLNYLIPSCKTSKVSDRGTTLIEDNNLKGLQEKDRIKRKITTSSEGKDEKRRKLSSDEDKRRNISHRSRSESSHRSSETALHKSSGSSSQSRSDKQYPVGSGLKDNRPTHSHTNVYSRRSFLPARQHLHSKFRNTHFRQTTLNQSHGYLGKMSFSKSGTGYFSWRRKYQPRKSIHDGLVITKKGSLQTVEEYTEWTKFKERETLRNQIENAIKEYRRTFEHTPDDKKGDEKVASYLLFLTERLDKIQSKRNKSNASWQNDDKNVNQTRSRSQDNEQSSRHNSVERQRDLLEKLENSLHLHRHEKMPHASLSRFSGCFAGTSDNSSYEERRHASGIEELLKEHLDKHCEHLTKQIKQEISKEIEERKTFPVSSIDYSSRQEHTDRSNTRDKDRNKHRYETQYKEDEYRRRSRERYDLERNSRDVDLRRFDKHENKEDDYYKKYSRCSWDKSNKGKYSPYNPRRDDRNEVWLPHAKTYDSSFDPYRNPYYHHYEYQYLKSNYPNPSHPSESHERESGHRKQYNLYHSYDKYRENNTEGIAYWNYYHASRIQEGTGHKHIDRSFRNYPSENWSEEMHKPLLNKGPNSNYQHQNRNDEKDGEENMEHVPDEYDATFYRKYIPTSDKKRHGFSRGVNRYKSQSKRPYQPAKYTRIRNPPTYFYYSDEDKNTKSDQRDDSIDIDLDKIKKEKSCR